MSVHWSSEIMKWEYRELQATAMSVDYSGNNVLLAGRRWLAIKQLTLDEDAGDILKKYPRQSKYDAAGAEWCQSYHGQRLCAISSNQRVDVYEWRNGNDLVCICSLKGHTRVVSDTHFHRQEHNIIATCSIDTFTHLWDLRDARKPILSLCAVAGASQVQWNKVAPHMIATAHDGDIKIWDYRKHSAPIHYISAHLCKIHGVDWSPHHEYQLVTSSHDGSIKYFDINNGRRPENTIMTNFPVWRAIYTPFGSGLLTIGVGWGGLPRVEQAGVIGIWVGSTLQHRLVGHTDTVQTMVWRPNTQPSSYQLVTWGRDQTLRIWAMHTSLLKMCNHYLPDDAELEDFDNSDAVSYASTVGSLTDLTLHDNKTQDLQMSKLTKSSITPEDEFESVHDMENIKIIDQDNELKTCKISYECKGYIAKIQVTFPKTVSEQTIPKFSWLSGTNLESMMTIKILKDMNVTAHRKKSEGQKCLQSCLNTMITSMNEIPAKTNEDADPLKSNQRSQSECENAGDACVPFPRTCGAKWCGVSSLVVFSRPPNARRMSLKHEVGTPRSMWSLQFAPPPLVPSPSPTSGPQPPALPLNPRHISNSITTFYFQDRWKAQGRRAVSMRSRGSLSGSTPRVVVYDGSCLFPINKELAERYIINSNDPVGMCRHNADVCMELDEMELSRSWALAGVSAGALWRSRGAGGAPPFHSPTEECAGWPHHPLCNDLLQNMIGQYAKSGDVQMAAMLACAFYVYNDTSGSSAQSTISCSSYDNATSPYSTVNQFSDVSGEGWTIPTIIRSNSCSEAENFYTTESSVAKCESASACVLDRRTVHLYHCYKRIYADILHRWQLLYVRTEVMKLVSGSSEWGVSTWRAGRGRCEVCALPVRGPMLMCLNCSHGGHHQHMLHWFSQNDSCPTGCGCKCVSDHNTWKGYKFT